MPEEDYPVLNGAGGTVIPAPGYDDKPQYPVKDGNGNVVIPAPPEPEPED